MEDERQLGKSSNSAVYHKNVDEVMKMTGHRNIHGVRSISKRTQQWLIKDACAAIDGRSGRIDSIAASHQQHKYFCI
jgi:hypothetical protein